MTVISGTTNARLKTQLPVFAVALSGITFGTIGYSGTYLLSIGMSVSQMLFWRFFIPAFALFFLLKGQLSKGQFASRKIKAFVSCFLLGAATYSVSTSCFFSAIPYIGSGIAMVMFYAFPILVALLNWLIDGKKLSLLESIAIAMMIPGIILLADVNALQLNTYGILLGVGSAFFYGIYFYASKKTGENLPPILASFAVCLGNAVFFATLCLLNNELSLPQTRMVWMQCLGFGIIGTLLPLWLLFVGLKTVPVTKAALISILEPITTVIIGVIVLEEKLSLSQTLGVVLMLLAVMMIQTKGHFKIRYE
jgi:drug/metabolite transporter (DMT)-like permease